MELAGFVSKNGEDLTIVGVNNTEGDVELRVNLTSFPMGIRDKPLHLFLTDRSADCNMEGTVKIIDNQFAFTVRKRSIFTMTSLQ